MKPVEIPLNNEPARNMYPAEQEVSEAKKTPDWYFKNLSYFLSFYNRPAAAFSYPYSYLKRDPGDKDAPSTSRLNPVRHMIRMMSYYLGEQPNMDYAHITADPAFETMQAQWVRGQNIKEFVDYFKGNMMSRVANAKWTAKPASKRAYSERTDMFDKLMMAYDMKPFLKDMAEMGAGFAPANGKEFDFPEQIKRWMDTDWKEYGSELCTDMASGIWFSEQWPTKVLQAFMHVVITSNCAMHHYVENGRPKQKIVMPYQIVKDNRFDNDYGYYDQFIGVVEAGTPEEIFRRFPEFDKEQRAQVEEMARNQQLGAKYNLTNNLNWWSYQPNNRNLVTFVTMYWRGRRDIGLKKVFKDDGNPRLAKTSEDEKGFSYEDVHKATIIGNRWITNMGYVDNLVEEFGNVSRPCFPIIRFQPNTFLGQSVSEVSRIYQIQDEIDYLNFKIREMVGKAQGRVYILNGAYFSETNTPKEFFDEIKSMGVSIRQPTGEVGEQEKGRALEEIDWTLDPNIRTLWDLIKDKEERMKKIMSASDVSMGQNQSYYGYNTVQAMVAQNSIGTAYLFDGFMEWIVMNMRYAVNQAKNLYTQKDSQEASFIIGDRGVVFLKLFKSLRFEDIFVQLNINDMMDEKQKQRILSIALANAQNDKLPFKDYLKIESAASVTEAQNMLEFSEKELEQKSSESAQANMQMQQDLEEQQKMYEAMLTQLKEDNANYRAELQAVSKNIEMVMQLLQKQPPESPLSQQFVQPQQNQ
jgi:hypothetical protein